MIADDLLFFVWIAFVAILARLIFFPDHKRNEVPARPVPTGQSPSVLQGLSAQEKIDRMAALGRQALRKRIGAAINDPLTSFEKLMELGRDAKCSDMTYFRTHPLLGDALWEKESLEIPILNCLASHWFNPHDPLDSFSPHRSGG